MRVLTAVSSCMSHICCACDAYAGEHLHLNCPACRDGGDGITRIAIITITLDPGPHYI